MRVLLLIFFGFLITNSFGQCNATFIKQDMYCAGICTGQIIVTPNGAVPITYSWSSGDTSANPDSLCEGYHVLTMIDDTGCIYIDSVLIIEPDTFIVDAYVIAGASGPTTGDGQLGWTQTGGVTPFTIVWKYCDTGLEKPTWSNPYFFPGSYYCVMTDANGCVDSSECVTVNSPVADISTSNLKPLSFENYENTIVFSDPIKNLEIFNLQGRLVFKSDDLHEHQIELQQQLRFGTYLIIAESNDGRYLKSRLLIY